MPPKTPAKAKGTAGKAAQTPTPRATPVKNEKDGEMKAPTKPSPPKSPTSSKKPKIGLEFEKLNTELKLAPVDVSVATNSSTIKGHEKVSGFEKIVKLDASRPFTLVTSILLEDGPYKGHQAILVKPSSPFPFESLPPEIRARIHRLALAPSGDLNGKIEISGGVSSAKPIKAKAYASKDKERLALLLVSKSTLAEARPLLYQFTLSFENTGTLLAFLSQCGTAVRALLSNIEIVTWQKANAPACLHMLSESANLQRLHIDAGLSFNSTPAKTAKQFWADAYRFLQAMGAAKGDKAAGMDMITFGAGAKCFSFRQEGQKNPRPFSEDEVREFRELVGAKLK
ncbi:hypothetical protein M8818_004957 [Zalaria obscura]|uniref:Uncharacterized protein n=1 Tax=Zalaria obscura TaxID=2024903 RepID=A0ACC3SAW2_9PEZI